MIRPLWRRGIRMGEEGNKWGRSGEEVGKKWGGEVSVFVMLYGKEIFYTFACNRMKVKINTTWNRIQ